MKSILAQFPVVKTFIHVRESTSPFNAWSTKSRNWNLFSVKRAPEIIYTEVWSQKMVLLHLCLLLSVAWSEINYRSGTLQTIIGNLSKHLANWKWPVCSQVLYKPALITDQEIPIGSDSWKDQN